jgi:hypothetical protein
VPRRTHRSGRTRVLAIDVALGSWAVCWIVLAFLIATEVRGLSDVSRTVSTAGAAVEQSGRLLERLGALPVVGDDLEREAEQVAEAGRQARSSGASSRRSVRRLSVLLGVAIAILPSAPLVLYLPWRVRLARERRTLRAVISRRGLEDEALLEILARRAAQRMPYRALLAVSRDPWSDIRAGRHERLAHAELARVGLALPSRDAAAIRQ